MNKKMREREEGSSPTLPDEIIQEIFSRLPVKSLMRFRCVSKQWRSLFIDPGFITKHMKRSTEKNQNSTHILVAYRDDLYTSKIESGTQRRELHLHSMPRTTDGIEALCDGLVCLVSRQELGLYNPATREFLLPPKEVEVEEEVEVEVEEEDEDEDEEEGEGEEEDEDEDEEEEEEEDEDEDEEEEEGYCYHRYRCSGLGFDPITKKYKLVKVTDINDRRTAVDIYTLGSHRWRRIHDSLPFSICCRPNVSMTVSGAVHWVAITKSGSVLMPESILSFDFQGEVFQEVPLPEFGLRNTNFHICVGVLGGCLTVSTNNFDTDSTDIWVMKEYGVKESWSKLFSMSSVGIDGYPYRHILPLGFSKDGEILLQKDSREMILYNTESETEMKLGFCFSLPYHVDYLHYFSSCASFVESLVSLRVESEGTIESWR